MAGRDLLVALKVNGDGSSGVNALRQIDGALNKTGDSAKKASRDVDLIGDSVDRLKSYAGGFVAIATARTVIAYADEFSGLNARLKLATASQGEYNVAQGETFAIAQRTRADLSSTVELYGKVQGAFRDLGGTQAEALRVTEAITQTFVISGASAASSAAGVTQFAQGLGAGALRGDELNSVLENSPRLAKALADGLGVSTAQLRLMGEQGKITGQAIKDALLGQADKISAEFATIPTTVGGALVTLRNSFVQYIGQADQATGASQLLVSGVKVLADNLPILAEAVALVSVAFATRGVVSVASYVAELGRARIASLATAAAQGVLATSTASARVAEAASDWRRLATSITLVGGSAATTAIATTAANTGFSVYASGIAAAGARLAAFVSLPALVVTAVVGLGVAIYNNVQSFKEFDAALANSAAQAQEKAKIIANARAVAAGQGEALTASNARVFAATDQAGVLNAAAQLQKQLDGVRAGSQFYKNLSADLAVARERFSALGGTEKEFSEGLVRRATGNVRAQAELTKELNDQSKALDERLLRAKGLDPALEALKAQRAELVALNKDTRALDALIAKTEQVTIAERAAAAGKKALTAETKVFNAAVRDQVAVLEKLNDQFATGQAEINAYQIAQRQSVENGKQYVIGLREENAILALGKTEREAATRAIEAEKAAREALGITTEADAVIRKQEIADLQAQILAENNVHDALVRHNEEADRVAENARRNAAEYTQAWAGGLDRAADSFGQFAASGFKSFSDFRRSIGDIAKNIIAELVATFLKQKIIVPIVAQLAGAIGGSGGGGILGALGGLFGGSGGSGGGGGIMGAIGSLFGGSSGGAGGGLGGVISAIGGLFGGSNAGGAGAGGGGIGGIVGIASTAYQLFAGGTAATAATAAGASAGAAAAGGTISGALAAIPVAGWIALAALAVNKISGGKLFGTRFETQSTSQNFVFGESGVSGSIVQNQTRQRSFFRGTARNTITSGLDAETQASIAEYFEKASAALRAEADATGGTFAGLIAADFSRQVDKGGKVIKEGGSILGRYYAENADEFQARVLALTRINQLGPEALALSEQFSNGASSVIAGAADFLVGAQAAIKAGVGIAGSSLTEALALTQKLAAPSENLVQTFARIGQSVDLLRSASAETGIVFAQTGADFSEFATRMVEAAGGVQAANELIGRNINAYFSEEERRVARLAAARTNAGSLSEAAGFGVNQVIGASEFRAVLNQALAGAFDPNKTAAILRYGAALAALNELAAAGTSIAEQSATAQAEARAAARQSFNDLLTGIAADARTAPETLSERLAAIREAELARIKALQDAARAAGEDADATRALTQIQRISARETAAAYQALADSTEATFRSLYGDVVQAQEDAFAGGVFNEFVFARLQNRVNLDPERFSQAQGAAANVRQLSENGGGNVFALLDRFSVPLDKFIADLGVSLTAVNSGNAPAQFDQFVFAARTLGIELPELADRFGVAIGRLEDESSPLNDAFERIIAGLSGTDKTDIESLFNTFQSASDAEREAARQALIAGIGDLSIAQQALFAPLIDEVDTTTAAEAQVEALGFLVDYGKEQTELLRLIAGVGVSGPRAKTDAPENTAVAIAVAQQTTATAAQSTAEQALLRDVLAELKLSRQEQTRYAQQLDAVLNRLARGN